jgi:hypothetical protein
MAWVQVGAHKINTVQICYIEQSGETVRVHFHGQWQGNPLELHLDEAKMFWRHIKAEDAMIGRDKGSAAMMPRVRSGGYDVYADPPKLEKPRVTSGIPSAPHTHHPQRSGSVSSAISSRSNQPVPPLPSGSKSAEHRKH